MNNHVTNTSIANTKGLLIPIWTHKISLLWEKIINSQDEQTRNNLCTAFNLLIEKLREELSGSYLVLFDPKTFLEKFTTEVRLSETESPDHKVTVEYALNEAVNEMATNKVTSNNKSPSSDNSQLNAYFQNMGDGKLQDGERSVGETLLKKIGSKTFRQTYEGKSLIAQAQAFFKSYRPDSKPPEVQSAIARLQNYRR